MGDEGLELGCENTARYRAGEPELVSAVAVAVALTPIPPELAAAIVQLNASQLRDLLAFTRGLTAASSTHPL